MSITINSLLYFKIKRIFNIKHHYMNGVGGYIIILFGYLLFLDKKRIKHKFKIINTKHELDYLMYRRKNLEHYYRNIFISIERDYFLDSDEEIRKLSRELKLLKLTK